MRIVTIIGTKFQEKNFETTFAQWEMEISKFEVAIDAKLYEPVKIGLLIAGTTGKIHDHLCLTINDGMNYGQVRDTIINYFKTKSLDTKRHNDDGGPRPMEVDQIKGKGKGKGKGTNNTGKYCTYCKTTTHNTSEC